MSSLGRVLLSLAVVAALAGAGCGDPPDKELQQAQAAIDEARAAGADQFARDEFNAAQDALKRANDAVAQRDYRAALNYALDARERAQNAKSESAGRRTAARASAQRALNDAVAALSDARSKLKAAEAARVPPRRLTAPRRAIADGDAAVQKARTAFEHGDYLAVPSAASGTTAHMRLVSRDLDAMITPPSRRRH